MVVTVAELMEALSVIDPTLPVALSVDEEGNHIHLINGVYVANVEEINAYQLFEIADETLESDSKMPLQIAEIW